MRVARERETQAKAGLKYAQTGPQQVAAQSARARQAQAQVQEAQAQLDQARLNLSYTKIVAPVAGIITRKSVEINQNVAPGQNLLMLVSLEGLWVTANFKETQLKHMSAKQPVEIEVDATGKTYHGRSRRSAVPRVQCSRSFRLRTRPVTTSRSSSAYRCALTLTTWAAKIRITSCGRVSRLSPLCG